VRLSDRIDGYGVVTRVLHWLMAVLIVGLFVLGVWMVGLDYYSPYYTSAPDLHRSLGIVTGVLLVARFLWVLFNTHPANPELSRAEQMTATLVQWSFYPLIAAIAVSGYLIATTDGRAIDIFGVFSLPSAVTDRSVTDTAGFAHRWIAYGTVALAGVHTAAALKHHFWDRNSVLKRMISGPPNT
jgi:cytochrome b561